MFLRLEGKRTDFRELLVVCGLSHLAGQAQSQGESPFPERRQASEVLGSNGKRASARRDSAAAGLGHLRFDPPKLVHHR